MGNLTNIDYGVSSDVRFAYDALNRATMMVDAVDTTTYGYAAGGQLSKTGSSLNIQQFG